VLTSQEYEAIVAWILNMHKCGMFITLQQLILKMAKIINTRPRKHLVVLVQEEKFENCAYVLRKGWKFQGHKD
jgi:hypothetical protein